jgi:hypothetical protein
MGVSIRRQRWPLYAARVASGRGEDHGTARWPHLTEALSASCGIVHKLIQSETQRLRSWPNDGGQTLADRTVHNATSVPDASLVLPLATSILRGK